MGSGGVARSYPRYAELLTRAAELGHAAAQLHLGVAYLEGYGVEKSDASVFAWAKRAADKRYRPAYQVMAHCYAKGVGCDADMEKAEHFLKMSPVLEKLSTIPNLDAVL